jgi:hypothetical protein
MAAIDKTFVNRDQLKEAINWAKSVGKVILENKYEFYPIDWIKDYNNIDNEVSWGDIEYFTLWNTPRWLDRWLWVNCPLEFVRNRLMEVYDFNTLEEFRSWKYIEPVRRKQKYMFLEIPKGHWKWFASSARKLNPWPNNCKQATYEIIVEDSSGREMIYDRETDSWHELFDLLPGYDDYIWQRHHKNLPNKKSIVRQLNKWVLPKGAIVKVKCIKYINMDFIILVK